MAVVIHWREQSGGDGEIGRDIGDHGGRGGAALEREQIGERLEGGTGRAGCLSVVDLAGAGRKIILRADQGQDVAGAIFENDDGSVVCLLRPQIGQVLADDFFGETIEVEVEGGEEGRSGS